MPDQQLRIAVVTGGASGIGAAVAQKLSACAITVHVLDRKTTDTALSHEVDVSDEASVHRVIAEIGAVDILVNVAGIHGGFAPCWEVSPATFERVLAVNLRGPFLTSREVIPGMMSRKWGRIVNVSSISARDGMAGSAAYSASKAGLIGLTRSIAKEVATSGILVNCVAPGSIDTPMLARGGNRDSAAGASPMQRIGEPSEVAELIAWLCSDACSYSTGALFDVSGGRAPW